MRAIAPSIHPQTVASLVDQLTRLFVVELVPPYATALRSKAKLRTSPKVHIFDPALTAAALNANADSLTRDLETLGLLFESAVIHDLAVHTEALEGQVYHYRDSYGYEIDAVLSFPGGAWGAVEVKLGGKQAVPAAERLRRAFAQIESPPQPPAFMAVIIGTGFTANLGDGVATFPLAALTGSSR